LPKVKIRIPEKKIAKKTINGLKKKDKHVRALFAGCFSLHAAKKFSKSAGEVCGEQLNHKYLPVLFYFL